MQVKAIMSAAVDAVEAGYRALPEIMIPLVVNVREIRLINEIIDRGVQEVLRERKVSVPYKVGTMMETPRATLGADRLAPEVEFMSFGTNDLTQMTMSASSSPATSRRNWSMPIPSYRWTSVQSDASWKWPSARAAAQKRA